MEAEAPPGVERLRETSRRLFFALWPDEPMRQAMVRATLEAARTSGGRPIPGGNLHITLAFLGSVPERQLPLLGEVAGRAATFGCHAAVLPGAGGPHIEVAFGQLEYWHAAHLLCAVPSEPSAPMAAVARTLQVLLTDAGFAPDLKPFRPHVTVVRKVSRPGPSSKMHPVLWRFTELALIESRTLPEGALYSVVESYSLCSGIKAENNSELP